jgi:holo-ACP synthase
MTGQEGIPVTLEDMLAARERRVEGQQELLARLSLPVISVTVVMPGAIKDNRLSRTLRDIATEAIASLCQKNGWTIRYSAPTDGATGPEALLAVETDAFALKEVLADLEDSHPLGRLWDLDVLCPERGAIGRRDLARGPRRCLICGEDAHACGRSRRHPLEQLLSVIAEKVDAYLGGTGT